MEQMELEILPAAKKQIAEIEKIGIRQITYMCSKTQKFIIR